MFVDEVSVQIKSGPGGNGAVAFRKEKYVPNGGPSGGDGGKGGDVILEADSNLSTLLDFRYQRKYEATGGTHGTNKDMHGKDAEDLVLKVPIGTTATNIATGAILADLMQHKERVIIAKGGLGGRGNARFASSTHQAPKFAENGEPGVLLDVKLELKLLADVGLVGYPNAGKSTLIAAISAARPKIADYPFTTLVPNLGVVRVDMERSFVVADIPGLIEGASEGVGLGHQFLRHLERNRLLVHLIDVSGTTGRDPREDYAVINRELAAYSKNLAALPQVIALNKIDAADPEDVEAIARDLAGVDRTIYKISAATQEGVQALIYALAERLDEMPRERRDQEDQVVRITADKLGSRRRDRRWHVERDTEEDDVFVVHGPGLERLVAMTNLENEAALQRLQRTMDRAGVVTKLRAIGAKEGDTVRIGEIEFDFIDEDLDDTVGNEDEEEE